MALMAMLGALACDDPPKKTNPFDDPTRAKQPPKIKEPPKPKGPPDFQISAEGPKIGWTNILLEKKDGLKKLAAEVEANKEHIDGKVLPMSIDRKAKVPWVTAMTKALAKGGASGFEITTTTRKQYPKKVKFEPVSSVSNPPGCSVVAKVLAERKNAVWSLKGGRAVRSPRGLAGPDMALTAESLTRRAKGCKASDLVFVSGDEEVEWGLVYDLAAATQTLGDDVSLSKVVLLEESPVAGRAVSLP